ncbi:hypothetical protein B0H11DRAFT_2255623 [Mycena galericulata]|nr:hypothetical protein B0H11DRAFT_2255623 [Mycena galericulata]
MPSTTSQVDNPNAGLTNYEFMQRRIAEQREKTRHRMTQSVSPIQLKSAPPETQEATRLRARYREKNRIQLKDAARRHRSEDFERKHGHAASEAKADQRLERQRLRSERPRRRGRLQARGKPKSGKLAVPVESSSSSSEDERSEEHAPRKAPRPVLKLHSRRRPVPFPAVADEGKETPTSTSATAPGQQQFKSRQTAEPFEPSSDDDEEHRWREEEELRKQRAYIEQLKADRRIRLARANAARASTFADCR